MAPDVIQPVNFAPGFPVVTKRQDPKEKFYRHFQEEVASIQEQIDDLSTLALVGGERQDAIDVILASISRLSNEASDASDFVPAYDQRSYAQAIKALSDKLNQTTTKLAPRSRFQFKSRGPSTATDASAARQNDPRLMRSNNQTEGATSVFGAPVVGTPRGEAEDGVPELPNFKDYNEEMARPGESYIRKPSFSTAKEIAIAGQSGLHIILPSTASRATSSGRVTDMDGCVVDMSMATASSAPFANLALKNIHRCLIVTGQVAGPAHITGISDSILVVAARQVRIHECKNVDVYLYCSSHPIIEDCSGLRFAPLPPSFQTPEDPAKNQWDQVDDFKWLKAEKSPNWSILPEESRIAGEVWLKTVPGQPGKDLNDILKAVGVAMR